MRLINTSTFALEEFGSSPPAYAILSHTWGTDEVKFDEFRRGFSQSLRDREGGKKLARFCGRAAEHGFGYAWMDTCCIDKSSSAELSEAINSMFRWYWDATACYVHLADVSGPVVSGEGERQFRNSRYFTRGWTLQELLAAGGNAGFYDCDWEFVGDRGALAYCIAEITRIPLAVIEDRYMVYGASVAQRMSWASQRQTTREEDIAYSLLGLFDVNMPLLYGEGAKKAFLRLQEEIMRTSADQSIFVWKTECLVEPMARGLLAESPADFKGAGNIVYNPANSERPYTLTKGVLEMTVCVEDQDVQFFATGSASKTLIVPLNCKRLKTDPSDALYQQQMCLVLQKRTDSDAMYERLVAMELSLEGERFLRYGKSRRIYIWNDTEAGRGATSLALWLMLSDDMVMVQEQAATRHFYEELGDDITVLEERIALRNLDRERRSKTNLRYRTMRGSNSLSTWPQGRMEHEQRSRSE